MTSPIFVKVTDKKGTHEMGPYKSADQAKSAVNKMHPAPKGKKPMKSIDEVKKKPVSQMTPKEKAADAKRRKEYNAFQKKNRNESVEQVDEGLSDAQIEKLRKAYGTLKTINPTGAAWKKVIKFLEARTAKELEGIALAKIAFISQTASDMLKRKHGVKLKFSDTFVESLYGKSVPKDHPTMSKSFKARMAKNDVDQVDEIISTTPMNSRPLKTSASSRPLKTSSNSSALKTSANSRPLSTPKNSRPLKASANPYQKENRNEGLSEATEAVSVEQFDQLKSKQKVTIDFTSVMGGGGTKDFIITRKSKLKGGKVEKITMNSVKNPTGVKSYLYKRNGKVAMAQGDMAVSIKSLKEGMQVQSYRTSSLIEAVEIQYTDKPDFGEDQALSYGRKEGYKEVGVIGTSARTAMVIFALRAFDKKYVRGVRLGAGEEIFRYTSRGTTAGGIMPLIKVNMKRGLAYYLTQESSAGEIEEPVFETKAQKLKFIRLLTSAYKPGHIVKEDTEEFDENYDLKASPPKAKPTKVGQKAKTSSHIGSKYPDNKWVVKKNTGTSKAYRPLEWVLESVEVEEKMDSKTKKTARSLMRLGDNPRLAVKTAKAGAKKDAGKNAPYRKAYESAEQVDEIRFTVAKTAAGSKYKAKKAQQYRDSSPDKYMPGVVDRKKASAKARKKGVSARPVLNYKRKLPESVEQVDELTQREKDMIADRKAKRMTKSGRTDKNTRMLPKTTTYVRPSKGEDDHIVMQLRRAQDSANFGNGEFDIRVSPVKGADGVRLKKPQIDKLLNVYDKLDKPEDKRKYRITLLKTLRSMRKKGK